MFLLKVFILINNKLLLTANAKDINIDYFCSDFPNESNGIFVLGVVFFFRQIATFKLAILTGFFLLSFKRYCCLELKFGKIFYL